MKTVDDEGIIRYYDDEGYFHREDGPAILFPNGSTFYYVHGKEHREDGPAVTFWNGIKRYCLDGEYYTKDEYKMITFFGGNYD